MNLERDPIAWAAPCISATARGLPRNLFGFLVATERRRPDLAFVAKRGWHHAAVQLDLTGYKVAHEPKFLSENVVLHPLEKKPRYTFLFARGQRAIVKAVVASIEDDLEVMGDVQFVQLFAEFTLTSYPANRIRYGYGFGRAACRHFAGPIAGMFGGGAVRSHWRRSR